MLKRSWRAAIIGGFIVWVWSAFSWMVLPWHEAVIKRFRDEREVTQVLKENAPTSGVYRIPGLSLSSPGTGAPLREWAHVYKRSPLFFGAVQIGEETTPPSPFFVSLICDILAALIICWILGKAPEITFWNQVYLSMLVGLFTGIMVCKSQWVFGGYSLSYTIVAVMELIVSWFIGGITIARVLAKDRGVKNV